MYPQSHDSIFISYSCIFNFQHNFIYGTSQVIWTILVAASVAYTSAGRYYEGASERREMYGAFISSR